MTDQGFDRDDQAVDAPVWPYILWLFAALVGLGLLAVLLGEAAGERYGAFVLIAANIAVPALAAGIAADRFVADRFRIPNLAERRRLIWWSVAVLAVPIVLNWGMRLAVTIAVDRKVPFPIYEVVACAAALVIFWLVYTYLPARILRVRRVRWARDSSA